MRVPEAVGVDFAQRFRIAVGGELVGRRNRVVAQALSCRLVTDGLRGSMRRMAVMIESSRCVWLGLFAFGPPPLLNP